MNHIDTSTESDKRTSTFKRNPTIDYDMSTILVTGAAGFIGSHLVEWAVKCGYHVRGLDNFQTGCRENLAGVDKHTSFTFIKGDIRDPEVVARAMSDVDSVIHLAAYTSVPGSFKQLTRVSEINCTGTATVLEAAVEVGVESVVLASSAAVYGSDVPLSVSESVTPAPESPYASSKLYGEQLGAQFANEFGIDLAALRFFNVYGPRQDPDGEYAPVVPKFIDLLISGEQPVIFGDGEQTRDFIFVRDVARACIGAVESRATGVYNIARGDRVSVNELIKQLNIIIGTDVTPIYYDSRPGDIRHSGADVSKAKDEFGFEASVALGKGLNKTVTYFKNL